MADFDQTMTPGEMARMATRGQIVGMYKAGRLLDQICDEVGCSRPTARKWITRLIY